MPTVINNIIDPLSAHLVTTLYPSAFGWAAAIMRKRGNILDHIHLDTGSSDGAYGAFAAGTGTLHEYIGAFHSSVNGFFRRILRGGLSGVRGVLLGTPEAHLTGGRPGYHLPLLVGNAHNDIIEAGRDANITGSIHFHHPLPGGRFITCWFRHLLLSSMNFQMLKVIRNQRIRQKG